MEFGPRLERSQGNRALLAEKSISSVLIVEEQDQPAPLLSEINLR